MNLSVILPSLARGYRDGGEPLPIDDAKRTCFDMSRASCDNHFGGRNAETVRIPLCSVAHLERERVLYQGIAARNFERSFQLADHVQVKGASLENGLLHIDLVREIPEAMKPRAIPIASSSRVLEVQPTKVAA